MRCPLSDALPKRLCPGRYTGATVRNRKPIALMFEFDVVDAGSGSRVAAKCVA